MEKKRRESTVGWVFESNEKQSNQEAEVTWLEVVGQVSCNVIVPSH